MLGTLLLAPQGLLKRGACTFATPDLFSLCRPGLPLASLFSPPVCLCSSVPANSCPLLFTLGSELGGACGGSSQVIPSCFSRVIYKGILIFIVNIKGSYPILTIGTKRGTPPHSAPRGAQG